MNAKPLIATLAALSLVTLTGATAEQPAGTKDASALTIASVGFMAGQWRGEMEGGVSDEVWSEPSGNNLMGVFRWLKPDGTPVMFEMMSMTQEPEGVFLRLVHFNGKLVAHEDKGDAVTLKLAAAEPAKATFKGVESEKRVESATYERTPDGVLHVGIHFADPSRQPLNFEFKRVGSP